MLFGLNRENLKESRLVLDESGYARGRPNPTFAHATWAGRLIREVYERKSMMHGSGKSDLYVVPKRLAKGNSPEPYMRRIQGRARMQWALAQVPYAATRNTLLPFTALLHHIHNPVPSFLIR